MVYILVSALQTQVFNLRYLSHLFYFYYLLTIHTLLLIILIIFCNCTRMITIIVELDRFVIVVQNTL